MKRTLSALCFFALTAGAVPVAAQLQQVHPFRDGTPGVTGYRSEVLALVMIQENEFLRLAEAFPADKYTWRPGPDVRSFSEVFLHVATANYNLPKLIGAPPPAGVDIPKLEKSTSDKAKVISVLKDSFAHERDAIMKMPDADLEKNLDWFGGKNTERGILLFMTRHTAEHLGQSIAYARFIGIVPPWTEDQQRQSASPPKGK